MAHADRFAWLRRDGAPLVTSLVLHMLALVLIAPWLVMRTIPAPQVEVEVMLEEDVPEPPSSRPEKALRLRDLVKVQRPQTRSVRPQRVQLQATQTQPLQSSLSRIELPQPSDAPAAQAGQGQTGQSAPAPREVAGLSAPSAPGSSPSAPPAAAPASPGEAAQRDGMQAVNQAVPSTPSLGSTPQPSSPAAAAPSRAGLDRQDGPTTLAGQAPQAQAAEPEFRQAARQGGQASMRGGSQAPEDGLARQQGAADQTALFASRSAPQSVTGGSAAPGGRPPALAAPAVRGSGRGSVAAAETAAPAHLAQPAPSAGGAGIARRSGRPSDARPQRQAHPGGRGSVAAAEPASATGLSPFAGSGSGQGVP